MATKSKAAALSPVETIADLVAQRDHLLELKGLTEAAPRAFQEAASDIEHVVGQLAAGVEVPLSWLGQSGGVGELVHLLSRADQNEYRPLTPAQILSSAKRCHPDMGGTAEQFRKLVEARDRLLAALGTSAPAPKEPDFTPRGYRTRYVSARSHGPRRIGGGRKLLAV